nr:unnamed protein product [Callosobruchus analis]
MQPPPDKSQLGRMALFRSKVYFPESIKAVEGEDEEDKKTYSTNLADSIYSGFVYKKNCECPCPVEHIETLKSEDR